MAMELLYLVKRGNNNESLRYSLRSVATYWPTAIVTIAGYTPTWMQNVRSINVKQRGLKTDNVLKVLRSAVNCSWDSDQFVLMNDDFFCLSPVNTIDTLGYGTTLSSLAAAPGWSTGPYRSCLRNTQAFLHSKGVHQPISYDRIHTPMPMHVPLLQQILEEATKPILHRSVYGNLAPSNIPRVCQDDAKVRDASGVPSQQWVSTNSRSWQGEAGKAIRSHFPEKCAYEK